MNAAPDIFDTALVVRRQLSARRTPSQPDFLLRRVAADFAERLDFINRRFGIGLDLGIHAGFLSKSLLHHGPVDRFVAAGPVPMCGEGDSGPSVLAGEEALPFAAQTFDLVVSGLSLQFTNDLPGALVQMRQVLKPDGLLLAALIGGGTLRELREAWLVAEEEVTGGASPRVAPFADVRDLGGLLQRAGLALPVADSDTVRVTYESPLALMRELKAMGASNMLRARRRFPVTRRLLARACAVYSERFGLPDGRVPATFEIITLTAWAPHESQQEPLKPGSAEARLAEALGVKEHKTGDKAGGG